MSHLEDWFVKHFIKKRGKKNQKKLSGKPFLKKTQKNLPRSKWKLRAGFKCKTCAGTCGQTSCTRLQPFPECTSGNQRSVVDRSSVSTGRVDTTILVVTDNLRSTWRACGWTAGGKQMTHTGRWRTCRLHIGKIKAYIWTVDKFCCQCLFCYWSYQISFTVVTFFPSLSSFSMKKWKVKKQLPALSCWAVSHKKSQMQNLKITHIFCRIGLLDTF